MLVVLTAFEAFGTDASEHPPSVWTKVFVFLALYAFPTTPPILNLIHRFLTPQILL
jgi:hypothetical protein